MKINLSFRIISLILISLFFTCSNNETNSKDLNKIPVIYSKNYNIKFLGLQKLHPFDTEKPDKIHKYLMNQLGINKDQFYNASIITEDKLFEIHTSNYLQSLNNSKTISKILEVEQIKYLPASLLKRIILKPMKFAAGGTLLGTEVALNHGIAINLSGGFHHAKANSGEGFSFYADINLAVNKLKENPKINSIMIVDLDAHQGNGHESIIEDDTSVIIFDVYNKDIFPNDYEVKKYIDYNFPIPALTNDVDYLKIIKEDLYAAIQETNPDFIIYNAGTDIYKGDLLGGLNVSEEGIIKRDELVFKYAADLQIPVLMLLSGGYSKQNADITARSIQNLLKKFQH